MICSQGTVIALTEAEEKQSTLWTDYVLKAIEIYERDAAERHRLGLPKFLDPEPKKKGRHDNLSKADKGR